MVRQMIYIGIDPGVNTGIAIIELGNYVRIDTMDIVEAMDVVRSLQDHKPVVYIENPNLRKYFGKTSREVLQGAGSIKRDFSIWKSFLLKNNIGHVELAPKDIGSQFDNVTIFKQATGWTKRTSKHSRDAARMIYKFYKK